MTTVALACTMHGEFLTQKNAQGVDRFVLFRVPEGMNMYIVSAAVPTICNVVTDMLIFRVMKSLIWLYCNPNSVTRVCSSPPIDNIERKLESTIAWLLNPLKQSIEEILTKLPDPEQNKEKFSEIEKFFHFLESTYTVKHYAGGVEMYDKLFSRRAAEGKKSIYDMTITKLTENGTPDILVEPDVDINLSQIIETMRAEGYTNIIFYDFSCGSTPQVTEERTERAIRRSFSTLGRSLQTKRMNQKVLSQSLKKLLNFKRKPRKPWQKGGTRRKYKKAFTRRSPSA